MAALARAARWGEEVVEAAFFKGSKGFSWVFHGFFKGFRRVFEDFQWFSMVFKCFSMAFEGVRCLRSRFAARWQHALLLPLEDDASLGAAVSACEKQWQ